MKHPHLGWYEETCIPIKDNKVLQVTTCKRSDKALTTIAKLITQEGAFNVSAAGAPKRLLAHEYVRVTERATKAQHEACLPLAQAFAQELK
jgi:hypothetical protein